MRNLPLLLALLLLSVLLGAVAAQASPLPTLPQPAPVFLAAEEEDEEVENEDEEAEDPAEEAEIEREICAEDPELCEEEDEGKGKQGDECLLKKTSATVSVNPGKRRLRLTVHYRTLKPGTVNVEASLRGPKGALFLGSDHTRLRRSGVYRDTFELPEKKMKKALAARDFEVKLQAVNTPPSCQVELSAHRDGAKKLLWS
jgi:hypothetical protein